MGGECHCYSLGVKFANELVKLPLILSNRLIADGHKVRLKIWQQSDNDWTMLFMLLLSIVTDITLSTGGYEAASEAPADLVKQRRQ